MDLYGPVRGGVTWFADDLYRAVRPRSDSRLAENVAAVLRNVPLTLPNAAGSSIVQRQAIAS
jgi:hypothetical protein